ncbi:hypothetical protein [Arcticibacter sp. MXS-1]|uniref:hypothetical protein n=1 Tax=Arcticibacter sp. MXS-1 TaxID=3341726 RepID=UPI0035A838F8
MLLGSTVNHKATSGSEPFILQLLLQQRYAEAYELLINQRSVSTAALYNTALCLHWSGNYEQALSHLERIQFTPPVSRASPLNPDKEFNQIRNKQNQTDDYLQGMSEAYVESFPALVHDAIVRLKTNCWLQLSNYAKVIAIATPIAHKGYKDITEALKLAR